MCYERVLDESLLPAYERLKSGLLRLIDEGKISREDAARVLPELRESDDEKIKKAIRLILIATEDEQRDFYATHKLTRKDCTDWLEKQKEQKPAEWSEVELEFRGEKVTVKRPFYRDDKGRGYSTTEQDEEVAWNALRAWCEKKGISLYDLYPKQEWSEENEKMFASISNLLWGGYGCFKENKIPTPEWSKIRNWLKSLRPSWKPSDEQMNCLCAAVDAAIRKHNESVSGYEPARVLKSLYEDLKKL